MGGMVPTNDEPVQRQPEPLTKLDWIEWRGLDVMQSVMDFGKRMNDEGLLPENRERIKAQIKNIAVHMQTFIDLREIVNDNIGSSPGRN